MDGKPQQTSQNTRGRHWRLWLMVAGFVAITTLGLLSVYHLFAEQSLRFDARLLQPPILILASLLLLLYFCADGLRLYYCLKALGYPLPLPLIFKLVFINLFFSNITPMATGGGLAQVWYLQRAGVPISRASAATGIRTLLAVVMIFSLAPAYLLLQDQFDQQSLINKFGPALAVFTLIYIVGLLIVVLRSRWLIAPASSALHQFRRRQWLSKSRHQRLQFSLRRGILRFSRSFVDFAQGRRSDAALAVFWTAVFLLSLFSIPALLIYALDYSIPYLNSVGIALLTTFVMYFAPTPGASGISEGVLAGFFQNLLTPEHLILVVVAWRFLSIYLGMLIGLVLLQKELGKGGRHGAS